MHLKAMVRRHLIALKSSVNKYEAMKNMSKTSDYKTRKRTQNKAESTKK